MTPRYHYGDDLRIGLTKYRKNFFEAMSEHDHLDGEASRKKCGRDFHVATDDACPATQAIIDPKTTYATTFDDLVREWYRWRHQIKRVGVITICEAAAKFAWLEAIDEVMRNWSTTPLDASRVTKHLAVAQTFGWLTEQPMHPA